MFACPRGSWICAGPPHLIQGRFRRRGGGTGRNVRVHDLEGGWTRDHEDLTKLAASGALVPQGKPRFEAEDHGTAVMGQLVADDNAFGVTGIVPDATPQMTNVVTSDNKYNMVGAITTAMKALRAGDVMLLEYQVEGCEVAPVAAEWEPATYDAVVAATSAGIIVVEAAGNGDRDLDAACNGKPFPRGKPDSGAIMVGAGGAGPQQGADCQPARTLLDFSNFGTRVTAQGWGECVVTTGFGDLQGGAEKIQYTAQFGGTSGASPIVTGAAAALSSIAKERGRVLTPTEVRDLLVSTGQAQACTGGKIGPLPDLRAAITKLQTMLTAEGH